MRVFLPLLLVLACVLSAAPATAATLDDLHTATVTVADKNGDTRTAAFRQGLERVLVKMTGTAAVLDREGAAAMLDAPARLVQSYRYEAESGDRYRLHLTFAGGRVRRQLQSMDIVVWGNHRPEVLVWLAIDEGSRRRILAAGGDSDAHRALARAAQRRGMPFLLPVMDARDRSRVEFVDISGGFFDTIRAASERYRGGTLLVGHMRRDDGQWRASWSLLGAGQRRAWVSRGDRVNAAIAGGVDGATERLASTLAGGGGQRSHVRARIEGVESLAAYARVSRYVDGLSRVRAHALSRVGPDELVFDLDVRGGMDDFERAIALDDMLTRVRNPAPEPASGEDAASTTDDGRSGARSGGDASTARTEIVFRLTG